jgi:very-short-patch-repair endonuclease
MRKKIMAIYGNLKRKSDPLHKKYQGRKLCDLWKDDFSKFYDWMILNGWKPGLSPYSKDIEYSPETTILLETKIAAKLAYEDSIFNKYGVKNISQKKDVIEKKRKTNLEKFGTEWPLQNKEIRDKADSTMLEKYGDICACRCEDLIKKKKETSIKKYGTEYPSQSEDIKEKTKKTMLEKYGTEYYSQTEEYKEKIKETNLERYGVEYAIQSDLVRQKINNTLLEKYGVENLSQYEEFKNKAQQTKIDNGYTKIIFGKTLKEISEDLGLSITCISKRSIVAECIDDISYPKKSTEIENCIENILLSNNIDFKKEITIGKYRSDFIIDNLIIEANGNYWHSDQFIAKNYHKEKRDFYIQSGYKPLFFCEDEILEKTKIVESIILNKLSKSNRIFARKCSIEEMSIEKSKLFFKDNHLMGSGRGRTYCLINDGVVLSAIRLVKKEDGLDISRFCHAIGYNVVGGFSKLLSYIEKTLKPKFIQTFIDLRYGLGDYLNSMGFIKETEYLSFDWFYKAKRLHRMNFKGNSGYEVGAKKIWDCGQAKYIKYLEPV